MRFAERIGAAAVGTVLLVAPPGAAPLQVHEQQRYLMGTMFSVVVYHEDGGTADRAIGQAMAEIARLDQVLSHYKPDSDLVRLTREPAGLPVRVDPSLYEVLAESLEYSRRSRGRFDVTIGALVRGWREAHQAGRLPTDEEIASASRCVGYEQVEMVPPDRVRLASACLELDLGGIGKGYAVDRALAVLAAAGVRRAAVNAGGSTIGVVGAPPGLRGWPVEVPAALAGSRTILLQDGSLSTSQQAFVPFAGARERFGEIIDTARHVPVADTGIVTVIARSATASDALSTTLLLMPVDEGRSLLESFPDVSAFWISPAGELRAAHRAPGLELASMR